MTKIQREGFFGEQMHGDRVSRKRVDRQNIEFLREFAFERQPRVSWNDLGFCGTLSEVRKPVLRDFDDLRIDLVKPDRKSTRLNSSHVEISYAVFCLKKKKKFNNIDQSSHASQRQ